MVTTKLAPQLAMVATLMAWPMMLTGYISLISSQKTSPRPMANDPVQTRRALMATMAEVPLR